MQIYAEKDVILISGIFLSPDGRLQMHLMLRPVLIQAGAILFLQYIR